MLETFGTGFTDSGIHGNPKCVRCGACCIYLEVRDDNGMTWKQGNMACKYLSYDKDESRASCQIHDLDERPEECKNFLYCSLNTLGLQGQRDYDAQMLREIAIKLSQKGLGAFRNHEDF